MTMVICIHLFLTKAIDVVTKTEEVTGEVEVSPNTKDATKNVKGKWKGYDSDEGGVETPKKKISRLHKQIS